MLFADDDDSGASADSSCAELIANLTRQHNETISEFLERQLGPKQLGLDVLLPVSLTYVLIFATGVLGNAAVCVVIFRTDELKSATNFYLISMALSDLSLLLLGLPNDLLLFWQQYPWLFDISWCKFRALISEMASNTSVLTIVVFSIERYVAICFPLSKGNFFLSDHARIVRVIACVWLLSLVVASPFAAFTTINHMHYPNTTCKVEDSAICAMLDTNIPPSFPIYELSGLLFFLIPLVTLMVLYRKMNEALKSSPFWNSATINEKKMALTSQGDSRKFNNNNKNAATTVRMLFAVVVTFFLCWAPFHLQRIVCIYGKHLKHYLLINEWLYYIAGFSYYISATINPILYNLMSSRFRRAFKKNICKSFCRAEARSRHQRDDRLDRGSSFTFRRRRKVARRKRPGREGRQEAMGLVVTVEAPEHADEGGRGRKAPCSL